MFNYPAPRGRFNVSIDQNKIYPPFKEWVESFGLSISSVLEAFYTSPNGGSIIIHNDGGDTPGVDDCCKINFTWGSPDSTTRWYKIKDESKLIKKYSGGDDPRYRVFSDKGIVPDIDISYSLSAEIEDVDLVYEAVIDKPSLINNSQLHSTYNPSSEHRWTLCFVLLENGESLRFHRALEIFKDYIIE